MLRKGNSSCLTCSTSHVTLVTNSCRYSYCNPHVTKCNGHITVNVKMIGNILKQKQILNHLWDQHYFMINSFMMATVDLAKWKRQSKCQVSICKPFDCWISYPLLQFSEALTWLWSDLIIEQALIFWIVRIICVWACLR